jgi:hypothetical protein
VRQAARPTHTVFTRAVGRKNASRVHIPHLFIYINNKIKSSALSSVRLRQPYSAEQRESSEHSRPPSADIASHVVFRPIICAPHVFCFVSHVRVRVSPPIQPPVQIPACTETSERERSWRARSNLKHTTPTTGHTKDRATERDHSQIRQIVVPLHSRTFSHTLFSLRPWVGGRFG